MSDILFSVLLLLLVATSAICSGITGGMLALNHYQLKRKAQLGDKKAKVVYPLHSLGYQLIVAMLLLNITANATIAIMLDSKAGGIFAVIFSTIFILFFGEILPMLYLRKHVISIVAFSAPVLKKILIITSILTKPVAHVLDRVIGKEAQLFYSKEELLRMFDNQKLSDESDLAFDELHMIRALLRFGDKKIRDVMTPRRMVRVVAKEDEVGPILMNDLHKSGHSRFPVIAEPNRFNFVGTLYLRDLVGEPGTEKVSNLMSSDVLYIHEEESLDHALRAFLKTRHHLFVVVNNFEEFVGVLSIEDVLEEVIGKEIVDEFDQYDDLRVVAKSLAEKEKKIRSAKTESIKKSEK